MKKKYAMIIDYGIFKMVKQTSTQPVILNSPANSAHWYELVPFTGQVTIHTDKIRIASSNPVFDNIELRSSRYVMKQPDLVKLITSSKILHVEADEIVLDGSFVITPWHSYVKIKAV